MFIKALLCIDWLIFIKPGSRTDAFFNKNFSRPQPGRSQHCCRRQITAINGRCS